jgi:DNA topoisomerase VI subunit A
MTSSSLCVDALGGEAAIPPSRLRQLQEDVEAIVLIFLSSLRATSTTAETAISATYRPSQLLAITQAFFVLCIIRSSGDVHDESTHGIVCTERDLYYRNPPLFGHQRSAHASIERLCHWLDVAQVWSDLRRRRINVDTAKLTQVFCKPQSVHAQLHRLLVGDDSDASIVVPPLYTRESIGIAAAGKGTLTGALAMELSRPPEYVDLSSCGAAGVALTYSLVARLVKCYRPPASLTTSSACASALVVIEKESIYHAVLSCAERRKGRWSRSYSFLCTKGYPCVASQEWLQRVHAVWPSLELHALVDGDPHGLRIVLTAMGLLGARARRGVASGAAVLPFHFIGVRPSCVFDHGITHNADEACPMTLPASQGISLCHDDRQVLRRVKTTLQKALMDNGASTTPDVHGEQAIVRHTLEKMAQEVSWMERSNVKCELQLACKPYASPLHFIEANISR